MSGQNLTMWVEDSDVRACYRLLTAVGNGRGLSEAEAERLEPTAKAVVKAFVTQKFQRPAPAVLATADGYQI